MTYNKQKALQILEQMLQGETNENVITAIQDQMYGLSLGLICYSEHLSHWSDIPEHSNQEAREYFAALHNIHKMLVEACVFDELE